MLRLQKSETTGLALPESTPQTLIEVDSASLPYACQCPLCGGLFQIPEGLLYRIEDDSYEDEDSEADFEQMRNSPGGSDFGGGGDVFESSSSITSTGSAEPAGGEVNDSAL